MRLPSSARVTVGERARGTEAINLFFGALLGANLGTFDHLPLVGYVQLVAMLAGSVIAIQSAVHARTRRRAVSVLLVYAALLGGALAFPGLRPKGAQADDFQRAVITLVIWLCLAALMKLMPGEPEEDPGPTA